MQQVYRETVTYSIPDTSLVVLLSSYSIMLLIVELYFVSLLCNVNLISYLCLNFDGFALHI